MSRDRPSRSVADRVAARHTATERTDRDGMRGRRRRGDDRGASDGGVVRGVGAKDSRVRHPARGAGVGDDDGGTERGESGEVADVSGDRDR